MPQKGARSKFGSVFIFAILALSVVYASNTLALSNPSTSMDSVELVHSGMNYAPSADFDNGTYVEWFQEADSSYDEWTQNRMNWRFGPKLSFEIFHENGTRITEDHYALIDEKLNFSVVVPEAIFPAGKEMGMLMFYGSGAGSDDNPSIFLMAYAPGPNNITEALRLPVAFPDWDDKHPPWYALGNQFNETIMSETMSYIDAMMLDDFTVLYGDECTTKSDGFNQYYNFIVSLTNDTPRMLYGIGMMVFDTEFNMVADYEYGSTRELQGVAVGIHPSEAWQDTYGGTYTLEKLDFMDNTLYSVTRGQDFRMRFNVSGDTPESVQMSFEIPQDMYVTINRTGWHWELVTEQGGWVYDDIQDTYVWNDTIDVTYEDYIYGPYEMHDYAEVADDIFVEVRYLYYDDFIGYYVQNVTTKAFREFRFIYNSTTDSFESHFGYEVWSYPYDTYVEGVWEERVWVEETPQEVLFELNGPLCDARQIDEEFIVEFVGHFTENMPVTEDSSYDYFNIWVVGPTGRSYSHSNERQPSSDFDLAKRIIIESPVTIAKVLTESGEEPLSWLFQINKGERFQVLGRLQGGAPLAPEIDAVQFIMRASDGYWTPDESRWSTVTYEITMEMDGTPILRAFNLTEMRNWTYGIYHDYVLVTVIGWHQEYNEATNTWEWTYGEYKDWQWTQTEGWHEEWWYLNQKTGEWELEWPGERSSKTAIPADFCEVTDFSWWLDGGDLYAQFWVNMSQSVLSAEYNWEFSFSKETWYIDYASDWGEHEAMSWDREWVYTFEDPDHPGEDVYVFPFGYQLAYFNDTLCTAEGVEYLKGTERPFIIIEGERLPIKVKERYDPYDATTHDEILFHDHYDDVEEKDYYYYELVNGTKIVVTYTESLYIFNVTLNNGMSFLTAQEYDRYWYYNYVSNYYWIDLDGNLYQGDTSDYFAASVVFYDKVEVPSNSNEYFVRYGLNGVLKLAEHWRWDSMSGTYFMTDADGVLYQVIDAGPWYEAFINGTWQQVSWPVRYYSATYSSADAMLVTWGPRQSWYHESEGIKHEMPYPGANAEYWDHLAYTESNGGMVPTTKSVVYQGITRTVYESMGQWYVSIGGTSYLLDEYSLFYSTANDTEIWEPTISGYTADVGVFNGELTFIATEQVEFASNYPWYDGDTDSYYVQLTNGTSWLVDEYMYLALIHEYEIAGKTFYSVMDSPYYYEDEFTFFYYYEAINGTWFNLTHYTPLPKVASYVVEVIDNGMDYVYDFMSMVYVYQWDGYYMMVHKVLNSTYPGTLFIPDAPSYGYDFRAVYEFDYHGYSVEATASYDSILRLRLTWGYGLAYGPQPIESVIHKNVYSLVIGVPRWGMWGLEVWDVNPDTGAVDLDGDLATVDDQYYVLEVYTSTETWNRTWDMMWVDINWDPNSTIYGDEMHLESWMGLNTMTWTYDWQRTYYWYYPETKEIVSEADFNTIKSTILTPEGYAQPGYWDLARMAENETYADYLAEAEEMGWYWVDDNTQTWTWLSFGMNENYGLSFDNGTVTNWVNVNMHYEFSGLFLWEDSNMNDLMDVDLYNPVSGEQTHYFIPDGVELITFITPGMAYGNSSTTGEMRVELDDEVTWGVVFHSINGTTYPYTRGGYWGWYEGDYFGGDIVEFDERPSNVNIDEISFLVHFQGLINETEGVLNNLCYIKVDNYIGNWHVVSRSGYDNAPFEGKSLALNYLAEVTAEEYAFLADGTPTTVEESESADNFQFETTQTRFAEMIMGGTSYDWSFNTSQRFDVLSQTTPASAFETAYNSEAGQSATSWTFRESMFYVTVGFPQWSGYSVYQDPVFVGYVSRGGTDAVQMGVPAIESGTPIEGVPVTIGVDVDSYVEISSVEIYHGTDQVNWNTATMTSEDNEHWTGDIPSYPEGTTVHYKVVVHTTEYGDYESVPGFYTVGAGTTITTTTTTTTGEPPELPMEMLILVAGLGAVILIVLAAVTKRRK